ncbi:hypothetical protein VE03_07083 [Pseudogymnoascus sp. 23342-1-I1]|nr:hypothetical protein VE03_07083 [Pseudogymnoascus sp. 23342-1-I1]
MEPVIDACPFGGALGWPKVDTRVNFTGGKIAPRVEYDHSGPEVANARLLNVASLHPASTIRRTTHRTSILGDRDTLTRHTNTRTHVSISDDYDATDDPSAAANLRRPPDSAATSDLTD